MRHNDAPIKDVLSELMRSPVYRDKITGVKVRLAWKAVVGEVVNNYTDKIEFGKGVLTVTLSSAPLRHNIQFDKLRILQDLNRHLEENLIISLEVY
jgi:hypothetical protein